MSLAFVFVNCAFDQAGAAEKALKNIQGVLEVPTTTGIYDLILKVQAGRIKIPRADQKNKNISGVTSTLTSITYSNVI